MTVASPSAFPGSRTLAGWWRHLAPLHPRALWVAHLTLHRVEALVRSNRTLRPDRVARLALDALALRAGSSWEDLEGQMHLGRPIVQHLLRQLQAEDLARPDEAGHWRLTARGEAARAHGEYHDPVEERRAFYFLDGLRADRPPEYVNLNPASAVLEPIAENRPFDVGLLTQCLGRSAEWKRRHGFPLEVEQVLPPNLSGEGNAQAAEWQRVILVRPEHLPLALVRTRSEHREERLVGYAVESKGWHLHATPALELDAGTGLAQELKNDLPLDSWRQTWNAWGQAHGLTPAETGACHLERREHRLVVSAPRPLVERLRASRGEKGEAWVLGGEGPVRPAALLDMVAAGSKK